MSQNMNMSAWRALEIRRPRIHMARRLLGSIPSAAVSGSFPVAMIKHPILTTGGRKIYFGSHSNTVRHGGKNHHTHKQGAETGMDVPCCLSARSVYTS